VLRGAAFILGGMERPIVLQLGGLPVFVYARRVAVRVECPPRLAAVAGLLSANGIAVELGSWRRGSDAQGRPRMEWVSDFGPLSPPRAPSM
jgi:hypothetical protein